VPEELVAYALTKYLCPGVNEVIEDVNDPVPPPLVVFVESATVGPLEVLHTTPLTVTIPPPSEETLPPEIADVEFIELIGVVVTIGRLAGVVKTS
jgi:hypothetical protein